MPVTETALPDFFQRSDEYSNNWQRAYLWSERAQLGALILAAGVSALGAADASVYFFAIALVAQIGRLATKADERWWNGRAGAESAKTASWLYMVGGRPFATDAASVELEFAERILSIAAAVAHLVPIPTGASHVTPRMREVRTSSLQQRVETYRVDRVQGQMTWYSRNSAKNLRWANAWAGAGMTSTGLGLLIGILCAVNDWSFDAVGLFSAMAASIAAWLALKQHLIVARSYAVASNELALIEARIRTTTWSEDSWSVFANDAEEAISREHTSWRASRAV